MSGSRLSQRKSVKCFPAAGGTPPIWPIVDFGKTTCHLPRTVLPIRGHRAVQDKRSLVRKRVLKTAQIVLSEKAPKLDCSVRNLSTSGACLQVSTTYGIPASFEVIIEGVRRPCRTVWRTDTRLGVTFG
ncbi:MAG TPA: PilZ domain-containing protein [Pseudolabrys sp.]|nr:PilZ domain-containing protein [Pseudolabrys sp.]